jgi:hypothetical protein
MFLPVDDQDSRDQLDFVVKKLEGYRSWQKGGVHEHASAERNWKRYGFRFAKGLVSIREAGPHKPICEHDLDVSDRQFGLVND